MNTKNIKQTIDIEISKTIITINELEKLNKPVAPDIAIGRLTRVDAMTNKSVIDASLQQARLRLNSLNNALSKIHSEDFGICMGCGKKIPFARFLIRPESVYCVKCAS